MKYFVSLFMTLFLGCVDMMAAEIYGITIHGHAVTSDNCNDLKALFADFSGKLYYKPEEKTLYMENATIKGYTIKPAIQCSDNITIKIIGTNEIIQSSDAPQPAIVIDEGKKVMVKADGSGNSNTLNIRHTSGIGVKMGKKSVFSLSHCSVNLYTLNGVIGTDGQSEVFKVLDYSILNCDCTGLAVYDINEFEGVFQNSSHCFNVTYHYVADVSDVNNPVSKTKINAAQSYEIYVADVQVNSSNYFNIHGDKIKGTVVYDPNTKTLTLSNAVISQTKETTDRDYWMLKIDRLQNVTIKLTGTNTLRCVTSDFPDYGIVTNGSLYIETDGSSAASLDISGVNRGIQINGSNTILQVGQQDNPNSSVAPKLTIDSPGYCLFANSTVSNRIRINNSTVKLTTSASLETPIRDFVGLDMGDYCEITYPNGAYYDTTKKRILGYDGDVSTNIPYISIEPVERYPLIVGHSYVHKGNKDNIRSGVKSGIVKFDGSNTLTLENAVIDGSVIALSGLDDLNIVLRGNNTIDSNDYGVLSSNTNINISSKAGNTSAVLNINSPVTSIGLMGTKAVNLLIHDCTVNTSYGSRIIGNYPKSSKMTVNNAYLTLNKSTLTDQKSGIFDFDDVILNNCYYKKPYSAYYDKNKHLLMNAYYNTELNECVIQPGESYGVVIDNTLLTSESISTIATKLGFKNGSVSYDANDKKVIFDNITDYGTYGVETYGDVTIDLVGRNNFYTNGEGLFVGYGTATLQGGGRINCGTTSTACVIGDNATLNIVNSEAHFESDYYDGNGSAIQGTNQSSVLNVTNSTVYAGAANSKPLVYDLKELNLIGCEIDNSERTSTNSLSFNPSVGAIVEGNKTSPASGYMWIRPNGKYLRGDINEDGEVNTTDVTALYNVIFGTDTVTNRLICDLNGDGDINTTDVTELYNIMFGTAN